MLLILVVPWGDTVDVVPPSTADNLKNAEPSIIALLSDMHRMTKAGNSYGKLYMVERK
jgi:hypothetical protein